MSRAHGTLEPHRPEPRQAAAPPGSFVSAELQSDCARFLQQLHDTIRRRREAEASGYR